MEMVADVHSDRARPEPRGNLKATGVASRARTQELAGNHFPDYRLGRTPEEALFRISGNTKGLGLGSTQASGSNCNAPHPNLSR